MTAKVADHCFDFSLITQQAPQDLLFFLVDVFCGWFSSTSSWLHSCFINITSYGHILGGKKKLLVRLYIQAFKRFSNIIPHCLLFYPLLVFFPFLWQMFHKKSFALFNILCIPLLLFKHSVRRRSSHHMSVFLSLQQLLPGNSS